MKYEIIYKNKLIIVDTDWDLPQGKPWEYCIETLDRTRILKGSWGFRSRDDALEAAEAAIDRGDADD